MDAQERPGRLFSLKIVGSWGTERVSMPPTARGRIPLTALRFLGAGELPESFEPPTVHDRPRAPKITDECGRPTLIFP